MDPHHHPHRQQFCRAFTSGSLDERSADIMGIDEFVAFGAAGIGIVIQKKFWEIHSEFEFMILLMLSKIVGIGYGCFSRKRLQYASIMKAYTNMP